MVNTITNEWKKLIYTLQEEIGGKQYIYENGYIQEKYEEYKEIYKQYEWLIEWQGLKDLNSKDIISKELQKEINKMIFQLSLQDKVLLQCELEFCSECTNHHIQELLYERILSLENDTLNDNTLVFFRISQQETLPEFTLQQKYVSLYDIDSVKDTRIKHSNLWGHVGLIACSIFDVFLATTYKENIHLNCDYSRLIKWICELAESDLGPLWYSKYDIENNSIENEYINETINNYTNSEEIYHWRRLEEWLKLIFVGNIYVDDIEILLEIWRQWKQKENEELHEDELNKNENILQENKYISQDTTINTKRGDAIQIICTVKKTKQKIQNNKIKTQYKEIKWNQYRKVRGEILSGNLYCDIIQLLKTREMIYLQDTCGQKIISNFQVSDDGTHLECKIIVHSRLNLYNISCINTFINFEPTLDGTSPITFITPEQCGLSLPSKHILALRLLFLRVFLQMRWRLCLINPREHKQISLKTNILPQFSETLKSLSHTFFILEEIFEKSVETLLEEVFIQKDCNPCKILSPRFLRTMIRYFRPLSCFCEGKVFQFG